MEFRQKMPWPPKPWRIADRATRENTAWLTGDIPAIRNYTRPPATPRPYRSRAQYNGGIIGATTRAFLGRPQASTGSGTIERHINVASELVEIISDLLFSNEVTVAAPESWNSTLGENLARMVEADQFTADLVDAGRSCSAYGWVFARIRWDATSRHPWVEWVRADRGMATWEGNRLTEITFVDTWERKGDVFRLLETHRVGEIERTLWKGDDNNLGFNVPYTDLEETAYLADLPGLKNGTTIATCSPYLTAWQVQNRARAEQWQDLPHLCHYGQSDITAGGALWAEIDTAYTELWHELDSARARLLVSEDYMRTLDPGHGSVFEYFRDVFPLGSASPELGSQPPIQNVQFDLRVEKYITVLNFLIRRAAAVFRLSPTTIGLDDGQGPAMTAKEIMARERRTINAWRARSRYWRTGLQNILLAWADIDAMLNGLPGPQEPPHITLVEPAQDTDSDRAERVTAWATSGFCSVETGVRHLHPEWGEEEIATEVAAINRERGLVEPVDPFTAFTDGDQ